MKYFIVILTFTALYCDVSLGAMRIEDLQQEVDNHDTELRMLHERIRNQEVIIDSIREEVLDASESKEEQSRGSAAKLENRISSLESSLKGAVGDIRQLREHANQSSNMMNQYKEKIAELNDNIDTLHSALQSLVGVIQPDSVKEQKEYVVVSGDSLEKIARRNKTTVKSLKSCNGLKNDKIFVGQKLKVQ